MRDINASASAAAAAVFANTGRERSHDERKAFERAIHRRAAFHGHPSIAEYIQRLVENPDEREMLVDEVLVGVTRFFRDDEGFSSLCTSIAALPVTDTIRCWSADRATGEEAYSPIMLLADGFDGKEASPEVRLFATDLDDRALTIARAGTYSSTAKGLDSSLPSDVGRPLTDFASCFPSPPVIAFAPRVLDTLESEASEAMTAKGVKYLTRIAPYRTARSVIDGILIAIADVTGVATQKPRRRRLRHRSRLVRSNHTRGTRK